MDVRVDQDKRIKIRVTDLYKTFGTKVALDHVSFDIEDGEFLSILGPSGCGKTTILRILIGLLEPTGGQIFKEGVDITNYPASKRGIGIVFQNYALFENMTVLGNVEYALRFHPELKMTGGISHWNSWRPSGCWSISIKNRICFPADSSSV